MDTTKIKPSQYSPSVNEVISPSARITVFDGVEGNLSTEYDLSTFGKNKITFGRDSKNDIVLKSSFVSRQHGQIIRIANGYVIEDLGSTNGLTYNGEQIKSLDLQDGDVIRIDKINDQRAKSVLLVFSKISDKSNWKTFFIPRNISEIKIGRGESCHIHLDHISVSRLHAIITAKDEHFYISDNNSKNGIFVNGQKVTSRHRLREKDLIVITNSKLIFSSAQISYYCHKEGIRIEANRLVKKVGREKKVICNDVSLNINPCEIVAIIGGSGAGKSTVMNCLSGYSHPTEGSVSVNDIDLYENFTTLKNIIGYVPQSDIVHDNLTVQDMLIYAAKLRLPKDISQRELQNNVDKVINAVELAKHKNTLIRSLSGGQRKRASIAVELLSDPNLFFLDEPTSGLDPGTERNLMKILKRMTQIGKTVIFVTHSTLNLHLCDKIVFMGAGGNLCFCGTYAEALTFFGVSDLVEVYNMITDEPEKWKKLFASGHENIPRGIITDAPPQKTPNRELLKQTSVLFYRHLHILFNDRIRLLLLLLQAPLLAFLISFVANGNQYKAYSITKSLLFALSCSAFWIGILNSVQEICKERNILKREYMTGVRFGAYITSKMLAMSLLCAVQSFVLTTVFSLMVGLPERGVFGIGAYIEIWVATFLTSLAASSMGILVSSLFKNADRAMAVAPLLLMPQLLFSGLIFELEGVSKIISYFAVCRWSMESYGTTANLNTLDTITKEGLRISREHEAFFDFTRTHISSAWFMLCFYILAFSILAGFVLRSINNER